MDLAIGQIPCSTEHISSLSLYRVTVTSGSKGFRKGHFPQTSDVGLFSVTFDTKKCSCKRILGAVNACSQKCGTITLIVIRCIFRARSEPKCVCRWCVAPDPTGVTYIILTTTPSFISERKARDGKEKGKVEREGIKGDRKILKIRLKYLGPSLTKICHHVPS